MTHPYSKFYKIEKSIPTVTKLVTNIITLVIKIVGIALKGSTVFNATGGQERLKKEFGIL